MGSSTYSHADYAARATVRSTSVDKGFTHNTAVRTGAATGVHPSLSPKGANRESRDSDAHPITLPIAIVLDTTGSMQTVPGIIRDALNKLMGTFLDDKASGKRYLGDAYPAVMVAAVDDYETAGARNYGDTAGVDRGTLQVGQFESGIEIDNDLGNMILTGWGGGQLSESYELALYFVARHTVTDHWEKRGRKGYLFIVGDEKSYPVIDAEQVKAVIGDTLQQSIPTDDIVRELQEKWNVFFIAPKMTSHFESPWLSQHWGGLLGGQHFLALNDPSKICELIAATVAVYEEAVGIDDLRADGVDGAVTSALVPVAKGRSAVAKVSADNLPAVVGEASTVERL